MTDLEKLQRRLPDETDNDVLEDCLTSATSVILSKRFPFGTYMTDVEPMYADLKIRIAIDLYNKRGAEGEMSHSENGISRGYESSWVSQTLLNEIVPKAGVI